MKRLFIFLLLLSTLLKIYPVFSQNMPFTMDQGRDLIDIRQIWENKDIRLIGPTTSINGVFLGPFYYYLISVPYLLFKGSPISILVWQIVCFQLAVLFFWKEISKKNNVLALVGSFLLLFSPVGFYTSRYFWNANFMPAFSLLFLTLLYKAATSGSSRTDFLLGLVSGLSLQVEAALGVLFFPFSLLFLFLKRSTLPHYSRLTSAFLITILPQLLFEIKHGFQMTKVLLGEFSGHSSILGQKLTFAERLPERLSLLQSSIRESSHLPYSPLAAIFALLSCYFFYTLFKGRSTILTKISAGFIFFSFVFYLFFSSQIKIWYIFGLMTVFVVFLSSVLSELFSYSFLSKTLVVLLLVSTFYFALKAQSQHLLSSFRQPSNDPSGYKNQLQVIDDIYSDANGQEFLVYNYLPSVYDYSFQYLFWWHGLKKYGYTPSDLAYLPNQPEYIKQRESFLKKSQSKAENISTYLIIQEGENKRHLQEWMGNFSRLCETNAKEYNFNQKLLKLRKCK